MARARRAIKEPLAPRVVRRLPQLAAGLAALALVGSAVGAQAHLVGTTGLTAVPAEPAPVARVLGSGEVSDLLVAGVDRASGTATDREADQQEAAKKKAAKQEKAAEEKAAEKKSAEKKAAETKAAEDEAAEQAAEQQTAEEDAAAEQAAQDEAEQAAATSAREERETRSTSRAALQASDLGAEAGTRWTTVDLNARTAPAEDSALLEVLAAGSKMTTTERTSGTWQQIELDGRAAWVAGRYLVEEEPAAEESVATEDGSSGDEGSGSGDSGSAGSGDSGEEDSGSGAADSGAGVSGGECPSGSEVESGLQPNAVAVHRSICHAFPSITSFGGVRADSVPGHPEGRAVDAMLPDYSGSGNALGWEIAEHVRANAGSLGVSEVIFDQKIWTTQRSGEGWRSMTDRGSDTGNHRDHVHVTVS